MIPKWSAHSTRVMWCHLWDFLGIWLSASKTISSRILESWFTTASTTINTSSLMMISFSNISACAMIFPQRSKPKMMRISSIGRSLERINNSLLKIEMRFILLLKSLRNWNSMKLRLTSLLRSRCKTSAIWLTIANHPHHNWVLILAQRV